MKRKQISWQDPPDTMLTPPQAAALLSVHYNSVDYWLVSGRLPHTVKNRRRYIRLSDLAAWRPASLDYADRLESALEMPAKDLRNEIKTIIDEMRGDV